MPFPLTLISSMVAIAVGLTSLYLFFLNKPSMVLKMRFSNSETTVDARPEDDGLYFRPRFLIKNQGRKYAEDVYVKIELKGWAFGDNVYKVAGRPTSSMDRQVGKENDEGWVTDSIATRLSEPDTILDVDSHRNTYLGTPDESREIFVNNVIYEKSEFEIRYGTTLLDPNSTYTVKYTIACRSHGPRTGQIQLTTKDESAYITSTPPTRLQRVRSILRYIG